MFTLNQRMDEHAVVSGNEAICYITLPDKRRKILANVLSLEAKQKFSTSSIPILGRRNKATKKGLGENTGTMKLHLNTSIFREAAQAYKDTGRDGYYDLMIVNADPDSTVGEQTVILTGVNFDEELIAFIDSEAEYLTETKSFTFNDWELRGKFNDSALRNA